MYGLIGTNKSKTSFDCSKFTSSLSSKMNSGCPFQHSTEDNIRKHLPRCMLTQPDIEDLFIYKRNNEPQKCCAVYLKTHFKLSNINVNHLYDVYSPLNYYTLRKTHSVK